VISVSRAHEIGQHWREQFGDEEAYEESWRRFWSMVGDPTEDKLEQWLAKDQTKDAAMNAGIVHEPLLPVRQSLPAGCYHCHGFGYVRDPCWSPDPAVCGPSHPAFGRAMRCPACSDPHHRCPRCTP
jgi:hypothetical protein